MPRSTVHAVVKKFLEAGFSRAPRLPVSSATLAELQERHLDKVLEKLQKHELAAFEAPSAYMGTVRETPANEGPGSMFALPAVWLVALWWDERLPARPLILIVVAVAATNFICAMRPFLKFP